MLENALKIRPKLKHYTKLNEIQARLYEVCIINDSRNHTTRMIRVTAEVHRLLFLLLNCLTVKVKRWQWTCVCQTTNELHETISLGT